MIRWKHRVMMAFVAIGISPSFAGAVDPPAPRYEMTTYYVGLLYRGPKWTPQVTPETK